MKSVIIAVALIVIAANAWAATAGVYYDPNRETALGGVTWFRPLTSRISWAGFVEVWWNTDNAYPSETMVYWSKQWINYKVSDRWAISSETELGINQAGTWAIGLPFKRDKFYILPKIGVSFTF